MEHQDWDIYEGLYYSDIYFEGEAFDEMMLEDLRGNTLEPVLMDLDDDPFLYRP